VNGGGVITSVTAIERRGTRAHVGNSMWCGGLCALAQTYVLKPRGGWRVIRDTGEMVIS